MKKKQEAIMQLVVASERLLQVASQPIKQAELDRLAETVRVARKILIGN